MPLVATLLHQATGVVSVQASVPLNVALLLLRARAYAEQRPIGTLAQDVLEPTWVGVDWLSVDPMPSCSRAKTPSCSWMMP